MKTTLTTLGFYQLIKQPTSHSKNTATRIDLFITNNLKLFFYRNIIKPICIQILDISLMNIGKPNSSTYKEMCCCTKEDIFMLSDVNYHNYSAIPF
jgi:hypothetical protein